MRKSTKALMAVILVATMSLGIGYAAIEDITLNISGTVTAIPLISAEIPQTVFYYVGYNENAQEWTPGDKATNLVLHYDGIYNSLNGSSISHSNQSTWSDLSGNGNNGSIVKGAITNTGNVKIDDLSSISDTVDWKFESGPTQTSRATGEYSWGNNYLNLDKSTKSFVICSSPTNIPVGNAEYTMEITFYYSGTSDASSGLMGSGIYNSASDISDIGSRLTRAYNKAKIWHIINWYFFNQYDFYPYKQYPSGSDRGGLDVNELPTSNPDNSGKANAIRINNNGDGIYQYYWDNDLDTGNKLTTGIHTITTKYKDSITYIFIDGQYITSKTSTPNTAYTLDYNHDRPTASDSKADGTQSEKYSVQPVTVGATHLKVTTTLSDRNNGDYCCFLGTWNKNHCYGTINFSLDYQEFFDGNIYSVRIYDRALEENEIKQNSLVDKGRFQF